ncbi:MAG: hypothetical protein Tsb0015_07660 [Simkaniaceae bacterium]
MVEEAAEFMPERFSIVGHSMGSWIAQAAAAMYPKRVEKIVVIDGWARNNPAKEKEMEEVYDQFKKGRHAEVLSQHRPRVFYEKNKDFQKNVSSLQTMHESFAPEVLTGQWKAMVESNDISHMLPKIQCPALVVHGRLDPWFDLQENEFIAETIPRAMLAIVEDAAHGTPIEQPQAVTSLIRLFFSYEIFYGAGTIPKLYQTS